MALEADDIADLTSEFEDLTAAAIHDAAELANAARVVDRMEAAAKAAGVGIAEMAEAMTDLETKAKKAKVLEEAKKAMVGLESVVPGTTKALDSLKNSAGAATANLMPTRGALGAVTEALSALGPKGRAVAIVLAVLATVVAGAAMALWGLAKSAVGISQEKDALAETFAAITEGAKSGLDVVNDLSDVAANLPFGEGPVLKWGQAMAAAGKSGDELKQSLRAIGASAAIMRDNGQAALAFSKRLQTAADVGEKIKLDRRMQRMLQETGVRASELAKALGIPEDKLGSMAIDAGKLGAAFEEALIGKGAGALEGMSLTWGSISAKLSDAWEDLFEDLGPAVQPLMKAIRDFFAEFSAGTTLQSGAKSVLVSFFTTVFGWAAKATRTIHLGFLDVQIAALKTYIWLAPLIQFFRDLYTNAMVLKGIKTFFVLAAIAVGLLLLPLALTVAAIVAIGIALAALVAVGNAAFAWLVGAIVDLGEKAWAAGSAFVDGLIGGIKAGVGAVVEAVTALGKSAEEAFTSFFGIRSPSTKMIAHGRQLPAGTVKGVEDGTGDVEDSIADMTMPRKPGRSAGGRATRIVHIEQINFHGKASEFPSFREQAEAWLDELAAGGDAPATT